MAWTVDVDRSSIEFLARHLLVTTVRGRFESFEGFIDINEADPQASYTEGSVDTASIGTGISIRDSSMRAPGRFYVKRYPKMTFRSTRIGPFQDGRFDVEGDLTIKDITKAVVFHAVDKGELKGPDGKRRWAFEATITIDRKEFDIKWMPLMELGGLFVADEIQGLLKIEVVEP
ncbi:MAG: YceI family protein [Anaerolineae bacterium]|jgi:polyisoprenoid-binding protein YceI